MQTNGIVLFHGIIRHGFRLNGLEKHFRQHGYNTLNLEYPSTEMPIEEIVEHVHAQVEAFARATPGKVHFVGYSMGGLIIRAYLHKYPPANLGRTVMFGTPDKGSEVADLLQNRWLFQKGYGPAGRQLGTDTEITRHLFGEVKNEVGIIAGVKEVDPIRPIRSRIIRGQNDGQVSLESTNLEGMADKVIVRGGHGGLPRNKEVWNQALHFLQHGQFSAREKPPAPALPEKTAFRG